MENDATTFEWFKLILDWDMLPTSIKESPRVQSVYNRLATWGGDPIHAAEKATVDYLRLLWRCATKQIFDTLGSAWPEGRSCRVVVTKPAIWSQEASNRTQRCAEVAIVPDQKLFHYVNIMTVSEPEAAAQAVLQAPTMVHRLELLKVVLHG